MPFHNKKKDKSSKKSPKVKKIKIGSETLRVERSSKKSIEDTLEDLKRRFPDMSEETVDFIRTHESKGMDEARDFLQETNYLLPDESGIEEVPEREPMSERTRTTRIEKAVDLRDYNAGFEEYKELTYNYEVWLKGDHSFISKDVYNYIGKKFYREPKQDFITVGIMHRELLTDAGIRTEEKRSHYIDMFYKSLKALAELGLIELS